MPVTKVQLGGDEFGETYHIGAAMILANCVPSSSTCHDWTITFEEFPSSANKPVMTEAQKTFLTSILNTPTYTGNQGMQGNPTISRNACTEDIIAPAFSSDPGVANVVANCFLSESILQFDETNGSMYHQIDRFIRSVYPGLINPKSRAIIRIRNSQGSSRNMTTPLISQIVISLQTNSAIREIIFTGDQLPLPQVPSGWTFHDLRGFLNNPAFRNIALNGQSQSVLGQDYSFAAQAMFFMVLENHFHLKMQIGMMSGAMDGTAFVGIPTIFFEEKTSRASPVTSRMGRAAAAIPWMEQVWFIANSFDSAILAKSAMPADTIKFLNIAISKLK